MTLFIFTSHLNYQSRILQFCTFSMLIICSRLTLRLSMLSKFYKSQIKNIQSITDPILAQKASNIKQAKPYFDRLFDMDPEYMARMPWLLEPIQPFVDFGKDLLLNINQHIGLPWPVVIMMSCVFIRITILPLLYIQIKRMSRLAPLSPVLIHIKNAFKNSDLPIHKRGFLAIQAFRTILQSQNLHIFRTFIYNIIHFPIIITMVYTIRKLLAQPSIGQLSFLHLTSLSETDPYFILPILTIMLHYFNFQRFITKENSHTILSRIRSACQILLILWFPWLCGWPSGIVLYMFTNAVLSTIQTSIMVHPIVNQKLNPKLVYYGYLLSQVEYDQKSSNAFTESIKTGNDKLKKQAIQQKTIIQKVDHLINHLNTSLERQAQKSSTQQNKQDQNNKGSK